MKNLKILSWMCVCVILLISSISAQHQHGNRGSGRNPLCEMSGYVYNAKTNTPIEHATVSVYLKDGSIETGGITDKDGWFDIDEIKPGHYNVIVEFIGFSKKEFLDIKLNPKNNKKDFGEILLEPSALIIEGIQVIEKKPI